MKHNVCSCPHIYSRSSPTVENFPPIPHSPLSLPPPTQALGLSKAPKLSHQLQNTSASRRTKMIVSKHDTLKTAL